MQGYIFAKKKINYDYLKVLLSGKTFSNKTN